MQPADWRFSQDENHDTVAEVAVTASRNSGWIPTFPDYLYVSRFITPPLPGED